MLIEAIKVALENPLAHGRGGPAGLRAIRTNCGRPAGFGLEWSGPRSRANSRIGRRARGRCRAGPAVQLWLDKSAAAQGESPKKVGTTFSLGLREGRRDWGVLRKAIRERSTRTTGMDGSWDHLLGLFFQDRGRSESTLEGERAR